MNRNILLKTDSYKLNHMLMYPAGTTKIYSYLIARSDKQIPTTLFYGLQYYLKEYLTQRITHEMVDEFLQVYQTILGHQNPVVISKMRALADLGYIPLEIKAVPEGTVLPVKNVLMTMSNTLPAFSWCVGFFESILLKVWNTTTVASNSLKLKKKCLEFSQKTCDDDSYLMFQLHDFGHRGCSSEETAQLSGSAHLLSFFGTDTVPAVRFVQEIYGIKDGEMIGVSVPATEHSVVCAYGKDNELQSFEAMFDKYPTGIISTVSDTYDLFNVLTNFTDKLKERILNRDGKWVCRPDSGFPPHIICGNPSAPEGSPERLGALEILWNKFGGTVNSKGYRILNPKVGLIYGDGIFYERMIEIFDKMEVMGFASSNIVFGIGGLLLQNFNRDTQGFAIKATYAEIDGEGKDLFKDPITDPGKKSHTGCMKLIKDGDRYLTIDGLCPESIRPDIYEDDVLQFVFRDGKILKEYTFDEIRERAKK